MAHRFRILRGLEASTATPPQLPPPDEDSVDHNSDIIIFFAGIFIICFLSCLMTLNCFVRCTWIRWFSGTVITNRIDHCSIPATKLLRSIPKVTYSAESMAEKFSDCAICLTEFVAGDEIRVLPRCSHCFHVACVDQWIRSHFTCPSCRQMLLKTTACNAGVNGIQSTTAGETSVTIDRFLP